MFDKESDEFRFESSINGYGAIICGGKQNERKNKLVNRFPDDTIIISGEDIHSKNDFISELSAELGIEVMTMARIRRHMNETDSSIIILEFDAMSDNIQTDIAQSMKGIAESIVYNGKIGYTGEKCDCVVRAEPDLSMRVQSFNIEHHTS